VRDRFEMLFEHNVDAVFFMTLDEPFMWNAEADQEALLDYAYQHLRVTAANPAMCEQMGAPRDKLLGTAPCERWADNPQLWRTKMRELYDNGRMRQHVRAPRSDGTWMDVEGSYVCLYDDQGRVTGHFGTQRDVTDMRKLNERLELVTLGGDIGIWDQDLVTNAIYYDERWIRKLGYSPEAPECRHGEFWAGLVHPNDMVENRRRFCEYLAGAVPVFCTENRLRTASGQWFWIQSISRIAARAPDGSPLRLVGIAVDINERMQLQERLSLTERMASIGTLAAGVAHEINNPLTYLVLNLTLIERELKNVDEPTRGRVQQMIDQARYGTERVRGIVRDLQALTRGPDEQHPLVDTVDVIERCLEMVDHQIRHRARVVRKLVAVPPVRGSESRMVQLFINMLVNAAQAIPIGRADQQQIEIETAVVAGQVVVSVRDDGVGIAPAALDRVFDPFFTTKPVGEGTGLGLAICRSIVSSMGGDIEIDSEPGRGTTVRVRFPIATADNEPVSAPVRAVLLRSKKRVLVIDDEPMVGQLVASTLSGHEVVAETSARSALARLASDAAFDLILCDMMMPEVSGMDFYEQVAVELRSKIVFLTGGAFTDGAKSFLDSVPNRRLSKPFDIDALTSVLVSSGDHDALP
jgi:PAS domain S-box-containing protein